MEYNAYDELMSYFHFEFNVYIVLVLIVFIGVIKSLVAYREARKLDDVNNLPKGDKIYDLFVSLLALLGLTNAMFFQGVISDIPFESGYVWLEKSVHLFAVATALFIIQSYFIAITYMRTRRPKNLRSDC